MAGYGSFKYGVSEKIKQRESKRLRDELCR